MTTGLHLALADALDARRLLRAEESAHRTNDGTLLAEAKADVLSNPLCQAGLSVSRWVAASAGSGSDDLRRVVRAMITSAWRAEELLAPPPARVALAARPAPGLPTVTLDDDPDACAWQTALRAAGRLVPKPADAEDSRANLFAVHWLRLYLGEIPVMPEDALTAADWMDGLLPRDVPARELSEHTTEDIEFELVCALASARSREDGIETRRRWRTALGDDATPRAGWRPVREFLRSWHRLHGAGHAPGDASGWTLLLLRACGFGGRGGPDEREVAAVRAVMERATELCRRGLVPEGRVEAFRARIQRTWSRRQLLELDAALGASLASGKVAPTVRALLPTRPKSTVATPGA
jgi:hypothetical protein